MNNRFVIDKASLLNLCRARHKFHLEHFLRSRAAIERLRGGLFGPHLDSIVATLAQLGYAGETVQERLRLLNAFDQWLGQRNLVLVDLHEAVVTLFLRERRDTVRLGHGDPQTVRHFLDHLRVNGVIRSPEPMTDESPLATLGRQYENYLGKERGVAVRSRNTRLAAIHSFFQYVSFQEPARADQCRRVLAIPSKRYELKPGTRTPLSLACARWVGHEDVIPRIAIWPGANPSEITTGDGPRSRRK